MSACLEASYNKSDVLPIKKKSFIRGTNHIGKENPVQTGAAP